MKANNVINNLKVVTNIIVNIICFAIPAFFAFPLIGTGIKAIADLFTNTYSIIAGLTIAIVTLAIWLPVILWYGRKYFAFVEKHRFNGWIYNI